MSSGNAYSRVEHLTRGCELLILNNQRDFVITTGQVESKLHLIAQEIQTRQTRIHIQACNTHGVVVIPKGCSVLVVRKLVDGFVHSGAGQGSIMTALFSIWTEP
jgi:hypothetical protein